jgi:competence protein ComEC
VGGLVGVFHGRRVGQVLVSPLREPESGVALVHRTLAAHGLHARAPGVGESLQVGQVRLDVLGPEAAFHGTRSDPNNSSLVLRATVHGVRILLSGDAEIEAQQQLLDEHVDLRADVLKVPHHGSAYSDEAFLAAVHAKVAVISVGAHNDYGQPSPRLLGELSRLGVPVHRTDRGGDTAICGTNGSLSVVVHGTRAAAARAPPSLTSRRARAR